MLRLEVAAQIRLHLLLLDLVLRGEFTVIIHVLLVNLLYNFVEVVALEALHEGFEVFLLVLGQSALQLRNSQLL